MQENVKEERKLKRLASSENGLEKLLAERAAIDKRIARVKAMQSEKERKEDTQVKIWIGAFFVKYYAEHPDKFAAFEQPFREYLGEKKLETYERWRKKHISATDTTAAKKPETDE